MPSIDIQNAISLLEQGNYREAIPLLEHITHVMPIYLTAHVLLARAHEAEQQWQQALESWQRAHFLMPNSPVTKEGIQRVLYKSSFSSHEAPPPPAESVIETVISSDEKSDTLPVAEVPPPPFQEGPPPAAEPKAEPETADFPFIPEPQVVEATLPEVQDSPPPGALSFEPPTPPPAPSWDAEKDVTPDAEEIPELSPGSSPQFEDLDRLIDELESASITPTPDLDSIPAPDLDNDIDDMVSETLARIYASQQQYDEAARVYDLLAIQQPERASEFWQKASEFRTRSGED